GTTTGGGTRAAWSTWCSTSPLACERAALLSMGKVGMDDIDVAGKRVLLREDFNVPMREGVIADDRRIRAALPTIDALRSRGARVIVVTHLGRPKGRSDPALTLAPVAACLGQLLHTAVHLATDVAGDNAHTMVASL